MRYIEGQPRNQITLFPESLDEYISETNPIRAIDVYIDSLDLYKMGFKKLQAKAAGRPPYSPFDLLKLYLYCFLNRIRSSRITERETQRNVEVMWLIKRLTPDHKTISEFRRQHPKQLKQVFKDFVKLCAELNMYGKELSVIDGSKFKAVNAKDKNFNSEKLEERIARLESRIEEYLRQMEQQDQEDDRTQSELSPEQFETLLSELKERKATYEGYKQQLEETGEKQISVTDPDSKKMLSNGKYEICHNVQIAVDPKNKLISEYAVTSDANDLNQLSEMATSAAETLEAENMSACADTGYDNASEIAACIRAGITPHVTGTDYDICIPEEDEEAEVSEIETHHEGRIVYIPERNIALCPMGKPLYPQSQKKCGRVVFRNPSACKNCTCKCTNNKKGYREYEIVMAKEKFSKEYNDKGLRVKQVRVKADKELSRLRKQIVEHPFGTIKRAWGAGYVLTRGTEKVTGEFALTFLAYNFMRIINILGVPELIKAVRNRNNDNFCKKYYPFCGDFLVSAC